MVEMELNGTKYRITQVDRLNIIVSEKREVKSQNGVSVKFVDSGRYFRSFPSAVEFVYRNELSKKLMSKTKEDLASFLKFQEKLVDEVRKTAVRWRMENV